MALKDKIPSADALLDSIPSLPKDILAHLGVTLNQATRAVTINQIDANSAALNNVEIDQVNLGSTTIGNITVSNASVDLQNSAVMMQGVNSIIDLDFNLIWKIDLGWIGSWSGNEHLGSIDIPLELGNIDVPDLDNIQMAIPSVNVPGIVAAMDPIKNLNLGKVSLDATQITKTTLPQDGLTLTGLGIGKLEMDNITMPAVASTKAKVVSAAPENAIVLPGAALKNLQIPATSVPNVTSGSFDASATASAKSLGVDLGILEITLSVTPTVHLDVTKMVIEDIELSALIDELKLNMISVPVDADGITVTGIELEKVAVDTVKF